MVDGRTHFAWDLRSCQARRSIQPQQRARLMFLCDSSSFADLTRTMTGRTRRIAHMVNLEQLSVQMMACHCHTGILPSVYFGQVVVQQGQEANHLF